MIERLRTEDEKHFIEVGKRFFGTHSFRKDPAIHAEQYKVLHVETNEELSSSPRERIRPA